MAILLKFKYPDTVSEAFVVVSEELYVVWKVALNNIPFPRSTPNHKFLFKDIKAFNDALEITHIPDKLSISLEGLFPSNVSDPAMATCDPLSLTELMQCPDHLLCSFGDIDFAHIVAQQLNP